MSININVVCKSTLLHNKTTWLSSAEKTDGVTFSKENATPSDVKKISIGDVSAFWVKTYPKEDIAETTLWP